MIPQLGPVVLGNEAVLEEFFEVEVVTGEQGEVNIEGASEFLEVVTEETIEPLHRDTNRDGGTEHGGDKDHTSWP